MMRGTPGTRLLMALLSPVFLLLVVVAIRSEETKPWMRYQEEFNRLYADRAAAKMREAESRGDEAEKARWLRVASEVSQSPPEIAQIYLEELRVADRCTTCHRGIDNQLFIDAPQPYRTHPDQSLLKRHDINRFGCTLCHDGQGAATTADAAHGKDANWLAPLLPSGVLQTACARCHEVTHGVKGAEVVTRGGDLFMEKGCYGCHDAKGLHYRPKYGPPLSALRSKLAQPEAWTYAWVKDARHINPATAMPDFKLTDQQIGAIAAFLLSLPEGNRPERISLDGASAETGERLLTQKGCRGCHGVTAGEASVSQRVPHLSGIGSKVTPEWLDRWLTNPKEYNPETSMPKIELADAERRSVVAYLLSLKRAEPIPAPPELGKFAPAEGKQLVKQFECYGCHAIGGFEDARPSVPDLGEFGRKPVDELDFGKTTDVPRTKWDWLRRKLREPQAFQSEKVALKMPVIKLDDGEVEALVAYVLAADGRKLPAAYAAEATEAGKALREMSWMTAHLHCGGCHRLDDREPHVARFFERKNLVPPTLDGVGGRLQGQYMYRFVLEPKQIRPWLEMRMPNFGLAEAQARILVDGFAAAAAVTNPYTYVAKDNLPTERFHRGIRRFRHYKCVQCHPTSLDEGLPEGVDPEDLSINLMLSKERLRPEWIKEFMRRPKQIAGAQTRMPTVFYTVEGEPKVERAEEDIEDITIYLMGMVEPPEVTLKAEEEAKKVEEEKKVDWTQIEY